MKAKAETQWSQFKVNYEWPERRPAACDVPEGGGSPRKGSADGGGQESVPKRGLSSDPVGFRVYPRVRHGLCRSSPVLAHARSRFARFGRRRSSVWPSPSAGDSPIHGDETRLHEKTIELLSVQVSSPGGPLSVKDILTPPAGSHQPQISHSGRMSEIYD